MYLSLRNAQVWSHDVQVTWMVAWTGGDGIAACVICLHILTSHALVGTECYVFTHGLLV